MAELVVQGLEDVVVQVVFLRVADVEGRGDIHVGIVDVDVVHAEKGDFQTALSRSEHFRAVAGVLLRADELEDARCVGLDEGRVAVHHFHVGFNPDVLDENGHGLCLIFVGRHHVVGLTRLAVHITVDEVDVIGIRIMLHQPLFENRTLSGSRIEDTLTAGFVVVAGNDGQRADKQH